MKTLMSMIAMLTVILMSAPTFAQTSATDTTIVVGSDTLTVSIQALEDWNTMALASGMPSAFVALNKKVNAIPARGSSMSTGNGANILNAMATRATANSRNLAWANALTAASGDSAKAAADPTYVAFQEAVRTGNAKVRAAIGTQFVDGLAGGTLVSAGASAANIEDAIDARISELISKGYLVTRADVASIAHAAAVLETGSKDEKKAAVSFLATF
jgi:hypothetical protein